MTTMCVVAIGFTPLVHPMCVVAMGGFRWTTPSRGEENFGMVV